VLHPELESRFYPRIDKRATQGIWANSGEGDSVGSPPIGHPQTGQILKATVFAAKNALPPLLHAGLK
jgi:hypothetical protein